MVLCLCLGLQCFKSNDLSRLGSRGIHNESVNVENYVHGVASIHLANVEKHIKAGSLLNIW